MFGSQEFAASLGRKFKDPVHYVISAVRLAYDDKPILNAAPMIGWLNRMGEPLYGRETPDGYPLTQSGWASPGQMTTRFEIARAIGSGSAGLFKSRRAAAGGARRVSAALERALLPGDTENAEPRDAEGARRGALAAGMEHVPSVIAGVHESLR